MAVHPRSPEERLLLACLPSDADPDRIRSAVHAVRDWEEFRGRAVALDVSSLVYARLRAVRDRVPAPLLEDLRLRFYRHAALNSKLHHALERVLEAFTGGGIPVMVLKGAALAELAYGNLALRPMRDLDLLVRSADVDAADATLRELGHTVLTDFGSEEWYRRHHRHLAPYVASDGDTFLELHQHVLNPDSALRGPVTELWDRARPATLMGVRVLIPSAEEMVSHACLQLSCADPTCMDRILGLCDIHEIVRRWGDAFDWRFLVKLGARDGAGPYHYYPLWAAREMLGTPIPGFVLTALKERADVHPPGDALLKRLIPRALLVPAVPGGAVPAWLRDRVLRTLMTPESPGRQICGFLADAAGRLRHSAKLASPDARRPGPFYTFVVHPWRLVSRAIANSRQA